MVSAEDLGGGDVHTRLSSVADYLAENDTHALALARQVVGSLNGVKSLGLRLRTLEAPPFDSAELHAVI